MNNPKTSRPVLILACCMLGAFFLPWFQIFGYTVSGLTYGRVGSHGMYVWVVPILSSITIILSFSGAGNRAVGALTGLVPLAGTLYALIRFLWDTGGSLKLISEVVLPALSIGVYVTLLCSIGIVIAAAIPAPRPAAVE